MKFLPGRHADETLIKPESFDAAIRIEGISPTMMAGLFHGLRQARSHWVPGLALTAELCGATDAETAIPFDKDLPDGLVRLNSGAPGIVLVEAHHAMPDTLLPQSLYLLLAQQWARAGLMLVHAAAFEFNDTGVLALGEKGTGKSVLTGSAMAAGARVVSDDWVMTGRGSPGRFTTERMREFVMLRHGEACERILASLPDVRTRKVENRPKSLIPMPDPATPSAHRFAKQCELDRLWILQRPTAGRNPFSQARPGLAGEALAALIRATMPVLFSRFFPVESEQLVRTARELVQTCPILRVEPGLDLVESPGKVLRDLI